MIILILIILILILVNNTNDTYFYVRLGKPRDMFPARDSHEGYLYIYIYMRIHYTLYISLSLSMCIYIYIWKTGCITSLYYLAAAVVYQQVNLFPLQMKFYSKCRIPKNNTIIRFKGFHLTKEIPSRGSRAGDVSRTSCPTAEALELPPSYFPPEK